MKRKDSIKKSDAEIENEIDDWHQSADFTKLNLAKTGKIFDPKERKFVGRPKIGSKFNVIFPDKLIDQIKSAAEKRNIGYQTMVRIIVSENIDEYC
jgi:predicted DNA binding CopG/RHH family protein